MGGRVCLISYHFDDGCSSGLKPAIMDLHANRGPVLISSVFPVATVATLSVVGRFLSRRIKSQPWLMDDYMVIVGLVSWFPHGRQKGLIDESIDPHLGMRRLRDPMYVYLQPLVPCYSSYPANAVEPGVNYGVGKHLDTIENTFPYVKFWKTLYAFNQIYIATGPTIKISLLLLYRRIFDTTLFRRVVFWLVCVNIAWWIAMCVSGVFTCVPVQGYWFTDLPGRKCMSLLDYDIGYAVVNIVLDVFILVLPVHMVWRLTLTGSQKVALTFIFLLGSLYVPIITLASAQHGTN